MINTKITEIAAYRNGSYITRRCDVPLKQGKQQVTIEGLTPTLNPETMTVSLTKEVKGSNIRVEKRTKEELEELGRELAEKIAVLQKKIEIRSSQIEMLQNIAVPGEKENFDVVRMSEYIDALPEKIEKISDQIRQLEKECEALNKEYKEQRRRDEAYIVKVDLEAEAEGSYSLQLRYYENASSWRPLYEIHTGDEDKADIRLKAQLTQSTIEDWKGVKIALYTSDPSLSSDIPELYPQNIGFYEPRNLFKAANMRVAAGAKMAMAMESAAADEDVMEEPVFEEMADYGAEAVQNDTMMEYVLKGVYDLDSKNPLSVDLTDTFIGCEYHLVAIPKLDSSAYLAARVKTEDIQQLLNSQALIYHKDAYLGSVTLAPDLSEETYDISLGRDETISLKREQKKRYQSSVLLKGTKKIEFVYELSVTSRKKEAAKVTLTDQIPVSTDKTITVDIADISKGKLDEDTGKIEWEFDLGPGETKTFTVAYDVSWPKDKEVRI